MATEYWTNVNSQTYERGKTLFANLSYTACSGYNSCNNNSYTLASRTAKARMITAQEAFSVGCLSSGGCACPQWASNFLKDSSRYGGIDEGENNNYWTMSGGSEMPYNLFKRYV